MRGAHQLERGASLRLLLLSALLVLRAAAAAAAATPTQACLLYIPADYEGFNLGALSPTGDVRLLWGSKSAWSGILGGTLVALTAQGTSFSMQPTLADGSTPLATFRLRAGGGNATAAYSALSAVPGHEPLGPPAVLSLVGDAPRWRVLATVSSADGAFSYYAVASFNASDAGGAATVALRALRDVTADVAALGGALLYGAAAFDPLSETFYLAVSVNSNQTDILAVPLANASAPAVRLPLPANYDAVSLEWSSVVASSGGRAGLVVLAQDPTRGALAWLALGAPASESEAATWTPAFSFTKGESAPEIGVGAVTADGAVLMALVLDASGQALSASFVDAAAGTERQRVALADPGIIAVDIIECAA